MAAAVLAAPAAILASSATLSCTPCLPSPWEAWPSSASWCPRRWACWQSSDRAIESARLEGLAGAGSGGQLQAVPTFSCHVTAGSPLHVLPSKHKPSTKCPNGTRRAPLHGLQAARLAFGSAAEPPEDQHSHTLALLGWGMAAAAAAAFALEECARKHMERTFTGGRCEGGLGVDGGCVRQMGSISFVAGYSNSSGGRRLCSSRQTALQPPLRPPGTCLPCS